MTQKDDTYIEFNHAFGEEKKPTPPPKPRPRLEIRRAATYDEALFEKNAMLTLEVPNADKVKIVRRGKARHTNYFDVIAYGPKPPACIS